MNLMNQCTPARKFQAIGYKLGPITPGKATADNERRILGDCTTYSQAATLALLWRSSDSERNRALVIMRDSPTMALPSLVDYSQAH